MTYDVNDLIDAVDTNSNPVLRITPLPPVPKSFCWRRTLTKFATSCGRFWKRWGTWFTKRATDARVWRFAKPMKARSICWCRTWFGGA